MRCPGAAKKVVLQADMIVDTDCMRQYPNLVRIPDFLVDAVGLFPHGCVARMFSRPL